MCLPILCSATGCDDGLIFACQRPRVCKSGEETEKVNYQCEEKMDKREYTRIEVDGLGADISDGVGFFPGTISDVSRFGLCMSDLPKRINNKTEKMTVVVSGHGKNFKMLVRPKWSTETGLRKMVGFQIVNTPWAWTDFVMQIEPESEDDVWGVINL